MSSYDSTEFSSTDLTDRSDDENPYAPANLGRQTVTTDTYGDSTYTRLPLRSAVVRHLDVEDGDSITAEEAGDAVLLRPGDDGDLGQWTVCHHVQLGPAVVDALGARVGDSVVAEKDGDHVRLEAEVEIVDDDDDGEMLIADGGYDESERFYELVERGKNDAESGEPEFRWSRVEGVWAYEGDDERAEELLEEIVDADGPTADTAQEALDVLTGNAEQEDDGARPLTTDWWHLTGFQRDILRILGLEGGMYGLAIKRELEDRYDEQINHGRLYPNLDDLVDHGTIVKSELDKRTNLYELTSAGEGLLDDQQGSWNELALDAEPIQQSEPEPETETESAAATDGGSTTVSTSSQEPTIEADDTADDGSEDEEVVIEPYEVFDESPMPARIDLPDVLEVVPESSTVYDAAAELDVSSEKLATLLWDLGLKKPQTKVIVDDPEYRVADLREMMNEGDR